VIVMRQGMPAIYENQRYRKLGVKLSNRPKIAVAAMADYLAGVPRLDLMALAPYDNTVSAVPRRNQGQVGDCVCNGGVTAIQKARFWAGMTYHEFSPNGSYAFINGGVDNGSDPGDFLTEWFARGLYLLSDVPDVLTPVANISAAAIANAARFRGAADATYQGQTFVDLVSADALMFGTTFTVRVGDNFGPDPSGVVGFEPGPGNHQVCGGQALRLVNGVLQFRFDNSWGLEWGINGQAWITAQHIDQQVGPLIYAYKWSLSDPLDPTNPPV
jgi:hypothetical protein